MSRSSLAVLLASGAVTIGACKSDCSDAPAALLLEIRVDDAALAASIRSLEVTLELGDHRYRRQYRLDDQLLDGRTSINVDLDPPPADETELSISVRAEAVESRLSTILQPDACNVFEVVLAKPTPNDAGIDAGPSEDGGRAGDGGVDSGTSDDAASEDAASEDAAREDAAGEDAASQDATDSMPADAMPTDAMPADAGFGPIMRVVSVDNLANAAPLSNYAVLIELDTSTPIAEGKMQANGADLRFYDADGVSPLDFWIASGIGTTTTNIWVEIPSLAGTSSIAIQLGYGDPSALPASDGEATFLFFADFDGAAVGNNGSAEGLTPVSGAWSVVANGSGGRGYEEVGTPSRQSVIGGGSWSDVAVSVNVRLPQTVSGGVNGLDLRVVDVDNLYFFGPFQQNGMTLGKYTGGTYQAISEIVTGVQREVWHEVTIAASGSTFRGYLDGALVVSGSDASFAAGQIGLRTWGTNVRYDDLRVRAYHPPEPVTIVGPEE